MDATLETLRQAVVGFREALRHRTLVNYWKGQYGIALRRIAELQEEFYRRGEELAKERAHVMSSAERDALQKRVEELEALYSASLAKGLRDEANGIATGAAMLEVQLAAVTKERDDLKRLLDGALEEQSDAEDAERKAHLRAEAAEVEVPGHSIQITSYEWPTEE